jgi:DHA1 family tetracycline resistance protein-like MFS transporter
MKKRSLSTIFIIVFVDLLGFSLILPLLPYYAETFGANPTQVGLLVAVYAAAQFLGAPLLGRLSDRLGRKPVLMVSIFGTFVGFILLGVARSLLILFLSRLLDGFTGGNISVAQAYISDVTDEKSRAKGLGLLGAAFGIGFIIGPAVGGALSVYGYSVPAFVAAGLSLIALLGVIFLLPESRSEEDRARSAAQPRPRISIEALWKALTRPRVGPILHIRFFYGLAFAMFQTIFPLYAQYRLNLDARGTGFVLTYVGILVVLVQGVGVGWIVKRYREYQLIHFCTILVGLSLFGWALTPNLWVLLVVLAPLSFAAGILNTVLNSALSKAVNPEEVGGTLGLSASLESLTRVIAPSTGGFLLGSLGTWAPGVVSGAIMLWTIGYSWWRLIRRPDPSLDPVVVDSNS